MQSVRIYEMPDCKMLSSGIGMFGEEQFQRFEEWLSKQPRGMFPKDFLFYDKNEEKEGFHWIYLHEEGMNLPEGFEVIDFKGGLYAVATDIDQRTDEEEMRVQVDKFLDENGFERDLTRCDMGNVITSPLTHEVLGYDQMEYYTPIKVKK